MNNRTLNLRAGPSDRDPVLASYPQGTVLKVYGKAPDGQWLNVETPDGKRGWVWAEYVSLSIAVAEVPVLAITPSPTLPATPTPALSGRIAYTVYKGPGSYDIEIINVDGSGRRLLVANASEPAFSPDGKQVLFYDWKGGGVDIMNVDGSGRRRVINDGEASYANFSPDGNQVVYQTGVVNWVAWQFDLLIKVCDIWGQNQRTITQGQQPAWNPKTNQIVCKTCDGSTCGLFVMNIDGSGRRMITAYPDDQNPAWSPDGRRIAFTSIRDGNWEIYVMNADGSNQRRLTNNPTTDALPVWLPDGRHIAFRSDRTGSWAIYVMNDDGSNVRKLVDAPVSTQRWIWEKMSATR